MAQIIPEIDIIILSYAQDDQLKQTTLNCINSLINSEDPENIKFNILVIESQKGLKNYQYPFSKTIYPDEPFGFHRYLNIGIKKTAAPFLCLCNNDLIFHPSWASEIVKYMEEYPDLISASPICPVLQPITGIHLNSGIKFGYRVGYEISGWCLFMRRTLFKIIGQLDENYTFAGADHDYTNTLAVLGLKHALITSSIVDHLNSETINLQSKERQHELNKEIEDYMLNKWYNRTLPLSMLQNLKSSLKL